MMKRALFYIPCTKQNILSWIKMAEANNKYAIRRLSKDVKGDKRISWIKQGLELKDPKIIPYLIIT